MAGPTRKQRLESLLYREIATTVRQELQDPRLHMVTITRVEMTADLHNVKAYFTVLGGAGQRNAAQRALDQACGFVQRAYAPAVRTRLLPRLSFAYDDREERRQEMDELIRRARSTDADRGETSPVAAPPQPSPAAERDDD
jgi:ribosome-binding factor A